MRNPTRRTAHLTTFTTCLETTTYVYGPEEDSETIIVFGAEALIHNGDETYITSKAAATKMLREYRKDAKAYGVPLREHSSAAGGWCTHDHSQEGN